MAQESELQQLRRLVADLEGKEALLKHLYVELQESETRLLETERLAQIGSWEMDIATGKSWWSEGFYRIIGLNADDVDPSAETGMKIIHPDDRERAASEVQKALELGKEYDIEKRIVRPNGEVRTVRSRGMVTTDEKNEPAKLVGAFMDVTDQKKIETEIRELNTELEHRVTERTKELQELNEKLQEISITDALTGIYNRRFFNEMIDREWRRAIRSKESLSLLMIDIDFFKNYNDSYGHLEGDECLRRVAGSLNKALKRSSDVLVRYGGEEFAALLPGTGTPGALLVAETMQQEITALNSPHRASPIAGHVTVSIGVASILPKIGFKETILIKAADQSLYEAKTKGRNRIVFNRYESS